MRDKKRKKISRPPEVVGVKLLQYPIEFGVQPQEGIASGCLADVDDIWTIDNSADTFWINRTVNHDIEGPRRLLHRQCI